MKNMKVILLRDSSNMFQQVQIDELRSKGFRLFIQDVGDNEFIIWYQYTTTNSSLNLKHNNIFYKSYEEAVKALIDLAQKEEMR